MLLLAQVGRGLLLAGVGAAIGYYLACLLAARSFWIVGRGIPSPPTVQNMRKTAGPGDPALQPGISILKPVRGADPQAEENFASFCRQDYPEYEVLFGLDSQDDPGVETAQRIAAGCPAARTVTAGPPLGPNLKASSLHYLAGQARSPILAVSDSDMRVEPDYLSRLAAEFEDASVGLVTLPYRGGQPAGLAATLEALAIGACFIPSALLARRKEGVSFAFGSTMAVRREALEKIGGFAALADYLADDYRLAQGIISAGYRAELAPYLVESVLGRRSFAECWTRRVRWARTVRSSRPWGYRGMVVTHGVPLALGYLAATAFSPLGWATLALLLAARLGTAWLILRRAGDPIRRLLWLLPLSDLAEFAIWAAGLAGSRVNWRGQRFRLLAEGRMVRES